MPIDPADARGGKYLKRRLIDWNPWWDDGAGAVTAQEYVSLRSDFFGLHQSLVEADPNTVGVCGPDEVGKSTLIRQLISALVDPDFVEKFYRHPGFRETARDAVVHPRQVLYIPLAADPLPQLHAADQLRAAVAHYETHYREDPDGPQYVFIDDISVLEAPDRRAATGEWAKVTAELVEQHPQRRVLLTGISDTRLGARLAETSIESDGPGDDSDAFAIRTMLPMKFTDFARFRFREIETTAAEDRFSATRARSGFLDAVTKGNATIAADRLNTELKNAVISGTPLRRELTNYLTVGGFVGLRLAAAGMLSGDDLEAVLRGQHELGVDEIQQEALTAFREMLRIRGPELGAGSDPAGLERLAAVVAAETPTQSIRYTTLTELLDIDRRTLRNKYFQALSRLFVLTPSQEYDNLRPRSVRVYLRDPGIANAFTERNLNDVLRAESNVEEVLAKSLVFDHTMRLSYLLNSSADPKQGVVKFWSGAEGEVDFVPKFKGRPVPMYWAGQRTVEELVRDPNPPDGFEALVEFLRTEPYKSERDPITLDRDSPRTETTQSSEAVAEQEEYFGVIDGDAVADGPPPFGVVLTTSHGADRPVAVHRPDRLDQDLLQIPQWAYLRMI